MGFKGLLLATSFLALSLSGCSYTMEEIGLFKTGGTLLNSGKINPFSESVIDFYVVKNTALKTCLDCHNGRGMNLGNEDEVFAMRATILDEVHSGSMPPVNKGYQPLSSCEKKILEVWLDNKTTSRAPQRVKDLYECGGSATQPTPAPTVTPQPTVTPTPSPTPVEPPTEQEPQPDLGQLELSYKNMRAAFFDAKCLNCHSSTAKRPKEPIMETAEQVRNAEGMDGKIIGSSGAESLLYKITVPGLTFDIMPPKRNPPLPQLTPAEADYLKRWIDAGMPE
ncbi:MAG: hypothetical protein J7501_10130 [Bdellovibrio sp.]|nr:hypothetical protein [Bdellovibrio sp.]